MGGQCQVEVSEEPAALPADRSTFEEQHGAIGRLQAVCAAFNELGERPPRSPAELLHGVGANLHAFSAAILACERAGIQRAQLSPYVAGMRALYARSPFVERLQTWPRGYPGDFETIEWLCEARNRAPEGTAAWAIEECALQSPVAQQHRNKVGLQARAVLTALVANPRARIASIGCGGCRDLSLIQDYLAPDQGRFTLIDADSAGLEFARRRLPQLAPRCDFVAGRVPRVLSKVARTATFDLVVAGGLFDYLPDRWAIATLTNVRMMLAPGGTLLFSNMAAGNPFRPWLEYLAEWRLIERDQDRLEQLIEAAGFRGGEVRIRRDTTSLAFMVEAQLGAETIRQAAAREALRPRGPREILFPA